MKYFYSLLIFCFLFSVTAKSQSNFKPGYILNTKKDTVAGFIDYREWLTNPTQVTFRRDINQPDQKVTVTNSNGFGINGAEYYYRAVVKVNNSPLQISLVGSKIDTSVTVDTVFLKTIVKGNDLSLYSYNNEIKPHFYIVNEKTDEIIALNKYLYLNDQRAVVNVNSYINQLIGLAIQFQPNDKQLQPLIAKSAYTSDDLSDIVYNLNGYWGVKRAKKHTTGTRFFVGVAAKNNKVSFDGPDFLFVDHSATSVVPEISAGVDIIPNKNTGILVFRLEVAASQGHFKIADPQSNAVVLHSLDFKQTAISFIPQILYNIYAADNFKVFIDAGVALNSYHYSKHSYISTFDNGSENIKENYPDFKSFQFSFPINAGVQVGKNIQISAGYTVPSNIQTDQFRKARISSIAGGVKYLFK